MDLKNINIDRKVRKKITTDISALPFGKVPPQARELEEAVLGSIMLERNAFDTAIEILKAECFYVDAHQRIFKAFVSLSNASQPIDILTVTEQLKTTEELDMIGGAYYISKLTASVVSSANLEAHCKIVLQKFIQRELIRTSGVTITDAFEDSTDVFDLLDQAEGRLFDITNNYLRKNYSDLQTVLLQTLDRINHLRNSTDEISGVPSGFPALDSVTYGWQPSDLIILAARPAVGKTAFALNLIRNAALHPVKATPVVFFSLEMSSGQLVQRILSAESDVMLEKISRGKLEAYEMQQLMDRGIKRLDKAPIFIDDTPALNIFELRAKCRRLKTKHNIGLIIIDYLQLMSAGLEGRNNNREQEISSISRNLKVLAKELQVPIIALSQLSREVEKRKGEEKMPQLSDLRESGAIEQDADMVMFIYRPDYHNITANEMGESNKGETHIRIAKHRNGSLDTIKLKALLHVQKFEEWQENEGQPGGIGGNFRPLHANEREDLNGPAAGNVFKTLPSKMNDPNDFNSDEMPF
jgi:replicative DNA helicase